MKKKNGGGEWEGRKDMEGLGGLASVKELKKVRVPIKHERPMTIKFQTPLKNKIKKGKKLTKEKGN